MIVPIDVSGVLRMTLPNWLLCGPEFVVSILSVIGKSPRLNVYCVSSNTPVVMFELALVGGSLIGATFKVNVPSPVTGVAEEISVPLLAVPPLSWTRKLNVVYGEPFKLFVGKNFNLLLVISATGTVMVEPAATVGLVGFVAPD